MTIRSLLLSFMACSITMAVPRINLFRPSDRLLMPEPLIPCWGGQLSIGYEGAVKTRAFRDDHDDCLQVDIDESSDIDKKANVLQIFGNQNALAALKGFDADTKPGQHSQLFNINDENGTLGLFRPCGRLEIPLNVMFSQRFYFNHGLSFALHLPVLRMELKNVRWRLLNKATTHEQLLETDFISHLRTIAGLDVCGWKRTGIGDLVAQMTWMRDFPQVKPLLTNVRVQTRFGLDFPTGKKQDEDLVLALPFGNDGSWGLQFGGGLDLSFGWTMRGGIDAEFVYLFGNTRCRRIKTAHHQTDLLFLKKIDAFKEFGLGQQYNIYLESCNFLRGLSLKVNYQFLKRNDDRIDIASDRIDTTIANSAESLQDWTAHSLIFTGRYDLWRELPESRVLPSFLGWFKWGFNGKRAILAHTFGIQFNIAF